MSYVADAVRALPASGVVMVGIDGIDGAGKTTFADQLARVISSSGRPVVRATIDTFHKPRAERYRRGPASPEGFFFDSHDLACVRRVLLDPLRAGQRFRRAAFDVDADAPVDAPLESPRPGTVLVFDGIFLHRPQLREYWDLSVFLDGWDRVSRERSRWQPSGDVWSLLRWCRVVGRYEAGQRLYLELCRPADLATIVIDNNDFGAPTLVRGIV